MAEFDAATNTIHAHIVYYGAAMAGKTTNFRMLRAQTPHYHWSEMASESDGTERRFVMRTGCLVKLDQPQYVFHLITTPGAVLYERVRTQMLPIADGVVFVVNSRDVWLGENAMTLHELLRALDRFGKEPATLPIAAQWNKRDLPEALDLVTLNRELNPFGWPALAATATKGEGVVETFRLIARLVMASLTSSNEGVA